MTTSKTIMLAAGGTGGHLYPAEALAEELLGHGHKIVIVTDKRGAAFRGLGGTAEILTVPAATFKAGLVNKIKAVFDILSGILQAARLLQRYKPALVIGFGGYPSFPAMFAAQGTGFKTLIHEQNAVLGKANLHLADKAAAIAAALQDTRGIKDKNKGKVAVTGNPVRPAIRAVRDIPYPPANGAFEIFITGGSTALTRVFNETVPAAIKLLPADLRARLHVVHQCRAAEAAATAARYRDAGVTAEIKEFFNDMPERLAACHLFIGRSGASTVAEITVAGRPAIFVPYAGHADRQQTYNAEPLAEKGGCLIIQQEDFTPQRLAA
ncbi:MAG: UDP-N-acetylglucosamine--N-acetylmuramyl-(pentapeptide) pyrophosphoryl-undecaprenol N-acetylglucosamine transferase, partial [Alphaproteobacteria bacterium]|nr:UDP-N-acetylglucosamine--N-acetylmuramyl-(pentapeptide) pyrophosphoryl-undecaprenol N-acetylglucosamine transferase [Alphaproteobacteria bacterium]